METRLCPTCNTSNPTHAIYCLNCGNPTAQQQQNFQTSPFDQPSLAFNQPAYQQPANPVMRCVNCRLLNYSGETVCKRCGGQLLDRNPSNSQPLQPYNASVPQPYQASLTPQNTYPSPQPVAYEAEESEEMQKAKKSIKNAWIAGVVSGSLTLLAALFLSSFMPDLIDATYALIASIIVFGLSYGISRKSRACAIILLCFFALDKIILFIETGKFSGAIVTFVFFYYYAKGIEGTFAYHKLMSEQQQAQNYRLATGQENIY